MSQMHLLVSATGGAFEGEHRFEPTGREARGREVDQLSTAVDLNTLGLEGRDHLGRCGDVWRLGMSGLDVFGILGEGAIEFVPAVLSQSQRADPLSQI